MKVTLDGKEYDVAHSFSATRVLVAYDGLYVFADRATDGTWELSGEPARPDEQPILDQFIAPFKDKSVVTVTKDDGSDPNNS